MDRQALLVQRSRGRIVSLLIGQHARCLERLRALLRWPLSSLLCQDPHTRLPALREIPARPPEPLQRPAKPKTASRSGLDEAPLQRRAQVIVLLVETLQPLCLLRTHQFRLCLLRQREEAGPMPLAQAFGLAGGD